jgi:hypothetical protein
MRLIIAALITILIAVGFGLAVYVYSDHIWYRDYKATVSVDGHAINSPNVFRHDSGRILVREEGSYTIVPDTSSVTVGGHPWDCLDLWFVLVRQNPLAGGVPLNDGVKFDPPLPVKVSAKKAEFTGLFNKKLVVSWE